MFNTDPLVDQSADTEPHPRQADRIRGSINVPLSKEGIKEAHSIGNKFEQGGGLDFIAASDLDRSKDTARIIAAKSAKTPTPTPTEAAHPWYTGQFDGTPSDKAYNTLNQYIKQAPDVPVPGASPQSTKPGESFNSFKDRWLGFIKGLMNIQEQQPNSMLGVTTHYINQKLNDAWFKAGAPHDNSIDVNTMTDYKGNDKPGDIQRIYKNGHGWELSHVSNDESLDKPGIYVIRHGKTEMNA